MDVLTVQRYKLSLTEVPKPTVQSIQTLADKYRPQYSHKLSLSKVFRVLPMQTLADGGGVVLELD